jgi:hypothetical protein
MMVVTSVIGMNHSTPQIPNLGESFETKTYLQQRQLLETVADGN